MKKRMSKKEEQRKQWDDYDEIRLSSDDDCIEEPGESENNLDYYDDYRARREYEFATGLR